jgi:hypothetical protein
MEKRLADFEESLNQVDGDLNQFQYLETNPH